ncbi:MAG TPA: hypothetical protein DER23_08900 [Clostridiales bacterium]|jgi:uncharacterized membrane protein required for colicin V production|nr:hypothetical protein [Clostridiales bacterium]HCG36448.1 hypothetical protein [Clostridiales bacterium]
MSVFLDLMVVAVLGICFFVGWNRGFVKTLLKFAGSLISLIGAVVFVSPVASFINNLFVANWLSSMVESQLLDMLSAWENNFETLFSQMPEGFASLLGRYGVNVQELHSQYETLAAQGKTSSLIAKELADYLTAGAANAISYVIGFILLFIAFYFAAKIVSKITDPIFRLPLLHSANCILGALLGLLAGLVFLWVAGLLIEHLVPYLSKSESILFQGFSADNTLLYKFFAQYNPINAIL